MQSARTGPPFEPLLDWIGDKVPGRHPDTATASSGFPRRAEAEAALPASWRCLLPLLDALWMLVVIYILVMSHANKAARGRRR